MYRLCLLALHAAPGLAADAPKVLLEMTAGAEARLTPSSKQVTASPPAGSTGVLVTIQPGEEGYPGLSLKPADGEVWDLSQYGHVDARIVNTGDTPLTVSLRVDNAGNWQDNPWSTESLALVPGESGTVSTIFGYSYGKKPSFPLKPAAVTGLLIFTTRADAVQSFRIENLQAAGPAGEKPPAEPAAFRVKPVDGVLLGGKVAADSLQTSGQAGASLVADGTLKLEFSGKSQSVTVKPPQGKWDLREAHQVRLRIRNRGDDAATLSARVESDAGPTDTAAMASPLAPGTTGEIVVSFIPSIPWTGIKDSNKSEWSPTENTGTKFTSDAATAVTLFSDDKAGRGNFEIESITASAPPVALPAWLGKRPPVAGEWTQTFNEDFNGSAIDLRKWNIYTANYWDQLSHFSKDNVIVANGLATLRYEKKTGRHNDDSAGKETPYATGFLDTHGKWVQRYGYFEARMKLPRAPGLWPALWLMPDRGLGNGEQWQRASTGEGGMEFDVMEFLSRWGPHRYNIAYHWDGYQEDHKQMGTSNIYTAADKDGFITAGMLWTPGESVMYCNGSVVARWQSPRISNVPSDLMFTHVMGGWDNDALDDSRLPDEFIIDYVRCWQRKDLASDFDGVKSTEPTPAAPVKR